MRKKYWTATGFGLAWVGALMITGCSTAEPEGRERKREREIVVKPEAVETPAEEPSRPDGIDAPPGAYAFLEEQMIASGIGRRFNIRSRTSSKNGKITVRYDLTPARKEALFSSEEIGEFIAGVESGNDRMRFSRVQLDRAGSSDGWRPTFEILEEEEPSLRAEPRLSVQHGWAEITRLAGEKMQDFGPCYLERLKFTAASGSRPSRVDIRGYVDSISHYQALVNSMRGRATVAPRGSLVHTTKGVRFTDLEVRFPIEG